jgi:hypothetical protein
MIEEIEKLITQKLESCVKDSSNALNGFSLDSYPGDISKYQFTNSKGTMLVRYTGSKLNAPETLGAVTQTEILGFEIILNARYLKKYSDSYKFIEEIKKAVCGVVYNNFKMWFSEIKCIGLRTGDILWKLNASIKASVQEFNSEWEEPSNFWTKSDIGRNGNVVNIGGNNG